MKKIISVVGARPNFMKVAPIHRAFEKYKDQVHHLICHTGQHYDEKMSKVFFEDLELPEPEFYLGVGSGSHAEQTANVMIKFEQILLKEKPDLIIVVGDVIGFVKIGISLSLEFKNKFFISLFILSQSTFLLSIFGNCNLSGSYKFRILE